MYKLFSACSLQIHLLYRLFWQMKVFRQYLTVSAGVILIIILFFNSCPLAEFVEFALWEMKFHCGYRGLIAPVYLPDTVFIFSVYSLLR